MSVGDAYQGLIDEAPSLQDIEGLGLRAGPRTVSHAAIQNFHHQEREWSTSLSEPFGKPFGADLVKQDRLKLAEAILEEAIQLEQELAAFDQSTDDGKRNTLR